MKLFAKYLPVKGKIKEGDSYFHFTGRLYHGFSDSATFKNKGDTKAKLFLCSRDIKVGDKVMSYGHGVSETVISVRTASNLPMKPLLATIKSHSKAGYTALASYYYKVLGKISSECSWVKEDDEFELHDLNPLSAAAIEHNKPITEPIKIIKFEKQL
jgi:hypothetical protein